MQNKKYRQRLRETVSFLYYAEDTVFDWVVNLAFSGIYSNIAEVYEENELVAMDPAYFEDTDDANVEILMNLWKRIGLTREKIMDLSGMEEDEVFDDT